MATQDTRISITSLDDSLIHHILHFLCGPDEDFTTTAHHASLPSTDRRDPIEEYAATLLRIERVSKHFYRIVQDDKLWGYWSVLDNNDTNFQRDMYLSASDYGPGIRNYDEQFQTWRELTMCKAVVARIRFIQDGNYSDEKLFGYDTKSSINYSLVRRIFRSFVSYFWIEPTRLRLRKESAAMLFKLVGEYTYNALYWANQMQINANREYANGRIYTVVDSPEIRLVTRITENDAFDDFIQVENLPSAKDHAFDTFIRILAYRAGVVKLTNDAFHSAKRLYCNRMFWLLHVAYHYHMKAASFKKREKGCTIFMPVPGQFEW
jgi:hypothetical protein